MFSITAHRPAVRTLNDCIMCGEPVFSVTGAPTYHLDCWEELKRGRESLFDYAD